MKHLWFQQALAMPGLGPRLLSDGQQRLPRYLFSHFALSSHFAASPASLSSEEVDAYIAQLREPNRARAASALYRHLVLPESQRIIRGSYRRTRLRTPTLLLFGAGDSVFPPALTITCSAPGVRRSCGSRIRRWRLTLHRRREAGSGGGSRPQVLRRAGASG